MDATRERRWYRLTPDRLVVGLLAAECLLWVSDGLRWPAWHKGYAVLASLAMLGVALTAMILWFIIAVIIRRRFQFSIRSLLVLAVAVALPFSWFNSARLVARRQSEDLKAVLETGEADYDVESHYIPFYYFSKGFDGHISRPVLPSPNPVPELLSNLLGNDFFHEVVCVSLHGSLLPRNKADGDETLKHLQGLRDLQVLYLGCEMSDSQLAALNGLKSLRKLNILNSSLSGEGLANLTNLLALRSLDMRGPVVTDSGLATLTRFVGLEELKLEQTKVTDARMESIAKLPNLRKLSLAETAVTDAGLKLLARSPMLVDLDLYRTHIGDEGVRSLTPLKRLERLELGYTKTTDAGITYLKSFHKLQTLVLAYTKVTDAGVSQLASLTSLQKLRIMGIKLNEKTLKDLQQALPDCKIEWSPPKSPNPPPSLPYDPGPIHY
jgi:hypothetical protein